MSDTPRTDAVAKKLIDFWNAGVTNTAEVVPADFARQLERDFEAACRQRDEAQAELVAIRRRTPP